VPVPAAPPAEAARKRKLSYKEQRELDALPAQIAQLEQEQQVLEKELQGGQLYGKDAGRAAQVSARIAEIESELMAALERWENLSA